MEGEAEEMEEAAAAMERAWDLHDKLSDAIHSLSRSYFLTAIGNSNSNHHDLFPEITSLNAIRNALEALENQLHLLHTLQLQQRAERDAALMHLEESRLMLLKRIKEHRGRDLIVIKEALDFATDEAEDAHFNSNDIKYKYESNEKKCNDTAELEKKWQGSGVAYFLDIGVQFVKNSDNLHAMAGAVAKVALVAVGMLAIFQLQRRSKEHSGSSSGNTKPPHQSESETNAQGYFPKKSLRKSIQVPVAVHYDFTSLDVSFGRG